MGYVKVVLKILTAFVRSMVLVTGVILMVEVILVAVVVPSPLNPRMDTYRH